METSAHLQPFPLPVGTQIGVYELKKVLAATWYGPIYLAWNHHLRAQAVIEEYLPRPLGRRADDGLDVLPHSAKQAADFQYGLDRFMEESEMLIAIEHPNVIRTDSALPANGTLYRVMQYLEGRDLASACAGQDAAMEAHHLYRVALQLLEALMQVHEKGYAHGAVHPACILQGASGDVVLQGFAGSQLALAARLHIWPQVLRDGYAAPEQYDAPGPPRAPADLYGLGATLYRCIAGRDPIPALQRIAARQNGAFDPQPKAALEPTLAKYSPALLRSIDSMLSLESADRPPSAGVVHDALTQAAAAMPTTAGPKRDAGTPADDRRPASRHLWRSGRWALGGGLAVAVLATAAFLLRSPERTQPVAIPDAARQARPETPSHEPAGPHSAPPAGRSGQQLREGDAPPPPPAPSAKGDRMTASASAASANDAEKAVSPQPIPADPEQRMGSIASRPDSSAATTASVPSPRQSSSPETKNLSTPKQAKNTPLSLVPAHAGEATAALQRERDKPAISHHLAAAQEHLAALRLTTPPGDNAYERFQAIEVLAPDHPKAREGMEAIVTRYGWLIQKALAEGRLRRARIYLERAKQVSAAEPVLEELERALSEAAADPPRGPAR
nr:protein kinase [Gammaproteobacteria bacterium]